MASDVDIIYCYFNLAMKGKAVLFDIDMEKEDEEEIIKYSTKKPSSIKIEDRLKNTAHF